jgi:hypothetical protein
LEHLVEGASALLPAAHSPVHILDGLYTPPLGVVAKFGELGLRVLLVGADAGVESDGLHGVSSGCSDND